MTALNQSVLIGLDWTPFIVTFSLITYKRILLVDHLYTSF